ncbi:hypothetical protein L195_g042300 [Trifolium pratense]|uniref:Uncharacterized protein n=1 Tax=Trifolium pratense TaxID=57577 RepID=A0A2K3M646_TRIPR|nr:hypothetical protein L195_g042300 [Trifolium pratense]
MDDLDPCLVRFLEQFGCFVLGLFGGHGGKGEVKEKSKEENVNSRENTELRGLSRVLPDLAEMNQIDGEIRS